MLPIHKLWIPLLIVITIMISQSLVFAADPNLQLTGEVSYVAAEDGLYGIIGDDGIKYQPMNLPRELRKDGLAVKFSAEIRDDIFTSIMWGRTIKIKTIEKINPTLMRGERTAIYVLLKRLTAFNNKDLTTLKTIDSASQNLSSQQFEDWIGEFSNFTLRYVEIFTSDATTITGSSIYTREVANRMTLDDGDNITQLVFTLNRTKDGWKLLQSSSGKPLYTLSTIKEQAKLKYGTEDLATIWR
jgi:hypothetical protein